MVFFGCKSKKKQEQKYVEKITRSADLDPLLQTMDNDSYNKLDAEKRSDQIVKVILLTSFLVMMIFRIYSAAVPKKHFLNEAHVVKTPS